MCLISKYLHCLKLCVYYYNKTSGRSCIYGNIIYKVYFTLLYNFLFHLIKFIVNDFVNIVLRVLKLDLFGTKYNLLKCMYVRWRSYQHDSEVTSPTQKANFLSKYPITQTIQSFLNSMLKHPTGRKHSPMGNFNQYILLQFQGDC